MQRYGTGVVDNVSAVSSVRGFRQATPPFPIVEGMHISIHAFGIDGAELLNQLDGRNAHGLPLFVRAREYWCHDIGPPGEGPEVVSVVADKAIIQY